MQSLASILLALLQTGLHLLEKLDAASAADFRRRVADDGAGVLLDQLNPGHTGTAGTAQPATGQPERNDGPVDGQR